MRVCKWWCNITGVFWLHVIECSFGRLKAHFGALRQAMDINISELPCVIYAGEDQVMQAMHYGSVFQCSKSMQINVQSQSRSITHCNEDERKKVRRILAYHIDP